MGTKGLYCLVKSEKGHLSVKRAETTVFACLTMKLMSEGLSKTVSFKKNHRKHQVEVLVRSPPAGTVALARGGLRTPAMTASCRNQ